jgi:hypothetical protein
MFYDKLHRGLHLFYGNSLQLIVYTGKKMKHVKVLILIGCMTLIVSCRTAPPVQFQNDISEESSYLEKATLVVGGERSAARIENADVNKGQTTNINMDEETFINVLNADPDKLSQIEGIWSNEKKTYKIGIQKAGDNGKYVAFILNSQEPAMKKGEIIAEFIETKYGNTYSTKYYLEDNRKVDTKTYIDEHGMLMILLVKWGKESVVFLKNFPDTFNR